MAKSKKKDPLERMHTKLALSDNVDRVKASAATSSTAPVKLLSYIVSVLTNNEGTGSGVLDSGFRKPLRGSNSGVRAKISPLPVCLLNDSTA